jgi:hypothetical protein
MLYGTGSLCQIDTKEFLIFERLSPSKFLAVDSRNGRPPNIIPLACSMDIETKNLTSSSPPRRHVPLRSIENRPLSIISSSLTQTTIMASDDFRGLGSQKWLLDINSPNELLVFYLTGLGRSHVVRTVGVIENVTMMVFIPVLR